MKRFSASKRSPPLPFLWSCASCGWPSVFRPGPFNGPFPRDLAWGIEATLDFYATRPVPPPKDAVHLASVLDAETHFFLPIEGEPWKRPVLLLTWGFDETTGAWVESARQKTVMAPSLLSYLYERAFLTLRVPKLPHEQVLHGEAPPGPKSEAQRRTQRQALETFVQKLRFHPVPHVDDRAVFYDRPEGALLFYPSVHAHDALYVFAADARERTLLAELVCDNLDFHPAG